MKDFCTKIPLIGVGPARTASTWLYHIFLESERVEHSKTKEVSYFNKYYDKQLTWYQSQFTDKNLDYWIDVTPQYIDSVTYCQRIYNNFPNAYVLFGLRDPIDRIRSLFRLLYYRTRSEVVDDYEMYLQEVLLQQIIIGSRVAFLRRVYGDNLVVIRYEALKRDPATCAKQVLSRCGILTQPPAVCNYVVNSLLIPNNHRLAAFGRSLFRPAKRLLPPELAWRVKTEIGDRLLMQKIRLERFLGEERIQRMIRPHLGKIERDQRIVEQIVGQ